jgi:hypothetical protein
MIKAIQILFTAIVGLVFLVGCGSSEQKVEEVKKEKLVVLLYDISKSNDAYAILKEEHLKELFSKIAFSGGGKFYSYLIQSNSIDQEVFEYAIPSFDTLALVGNPYQIKNRVKRNAEILEPFNRFQSEFIDRTKNEIIKPKTARFTDLQNALNLGYTTINQEMYKNWNKSLIIISDGINDLPPNDGEDKMEQVDFSNSKVILVRPTRTEYITGNPLTITNSINDALMNL